MELQISEPWEFEAEVGTGYLGGQVAGTVQEAHHDRVELLVALSEPVTFREATFDAVVARARYRTSPEVAPLAAATFNFEPVRLHGHRRPDVPFLIGSMRLRGSPSG